MSFKITNENIDYIFGSTSAKIYKSKEPEKHKIIKDLYFNNGIASKSIKKLLEKVWW